MNKINVNKIIELYSGEHKSIYDILNDYVRGGGLANYLEIQSRNLLKNKT